MKYPSFRIKSRKSNKYYKVIVYPTTKELIEAANEHSEISGDPQKNYEGSAGVCHSYEKIKIHEDGQEEVSDEVGTIRLAQTHLSSEIVAHELAHAAMNLYRITYGKDRVANFGTECNPNEEEFCYIYGQMFRDMNSKLHKHNVWK